MRISKIVLGAAIALSMAMPLATQAASLTTDQVNAIVNLLQSFNADAKTVAQVQAVLTNQKQGGDWNMSSSSWSGASTTPWGTPGQTGKMMCIKLDRDLKEGSSGDDVRKLQDMLRDDDSSNFSASSTGFFGPKTAQALMHFQMEHGIASSTTGIAGPLTRGFFERACGEGLDHGHDHKDSTSSQN